jgi:hypothetical protein
MHLATWKLFLESRAPEGPRFRKRRSRVKKSQPRVRIKSRHKDMLAVAYAAPLLRLDFLVKTPASPLDHVNVLSKSITEWLQCTQDLSGTLYFKSPGRWMYEREYSFDCL